MSTAGTAWHGEAWRGMAGPSVERQSGHGTALLVPAGLGWARRGEAGGARRGGARRGEAWRGAAGLGVAGWARLGRAWHGSARHGLAGRGRAGVEWPGKAGRGSARCGMAVKGVARFGSAGHGTARLGMAQQDSAPRLMAVLDPLDFNPACQVRWSGSPRRCGEDAVGAWRCTHCGNTIMCSESCRARLAPYAHRMVMCVPCHSAGKLARLYEWVPFGTGS